MCRGVQEAALTFLFSSASRAASAPKSHPLLSCTSIFWREFKAAVAGASPKGGEPCSLISTVNSLQESGEYSSDGIPMDSVVEAVARIFLRSSTVYRGMGAVAASSQNPGDFYLLCQEMGHMPYSDWDGQWEEDSAWGRMIQGDPYGEFGPPCLYGWVTAAVCLAHLISERIAGRLPDTVVQWIWKLYEEEHDMKGSEHEIWQDAVATLDTEDAKKGAKAMFSRMRLSLWGTFRNGNRFLSLLDSSTWPVRLRDVLKYMRDPSLDEASLSSAVAFHSRATRAAPPGGVCRPTKLQDSREIIVWIVSLHGNLAVEPASIWSELAETHGLRILALPFMKHYNASAAGLELRELFKSGIEYNRTSRFTRSNRFPSIDDVASFRSKFLDLAPRVPDFRRSDVLFCGEPAFFCGLLYEIGSKPVMGYAGNSLGAYLFEKDDQRDYYDMVAQAMSANGDGHPKFAMTFVSAHLAAQAYWNTGVEFPVVRPLGRYTGMTHYPEVRDVLTTKQISPFWDFPCMLNYFVQGADWRFVEMSFLQDKSYLSWSRHRACVFLPYELETLIFYELYAMGLPLLVPAEPLLHLFFVKCYGNVRDVYVQRRALKLDVPDTDGPLAWGPWYDDKDIESGGSLGQLSWWGSLSDMARLPHILKWNSLAEVLDILSWENEWKLRESSTGMRRETDIAFVRASTFWHALLTNMVKS